MQSSSSRQVSGRAKALPSTPLRRSPRGAKAIAIKVESVKQESLDTVSAFTSMCVKQESIETTFVFSVGGVKAEKQ